MRWCTMADQWCDAGWCQVCPVVFQSANKTGSILWQEVSRSRTGGGVTLATGDLETAKTSCEHNTGMLSHFKLIWQTSLLNLDICTGFPI